MSFTISVRVYQTNPNAFFHLVEKTVWRDANGGTWSKVKGEHVLTLGASGTSGALRFQSDTGEEFLAVFGVHNYVRWADIDTSLVPGSTGCFINSEYYNGGWRTYKREEMLRCYSVTSARQRKYTINYVVAEGYNLKADLIIG